MRFKASIRNISTFTKFTASLSSLSKIAWVRLDDNQVRFTIIPEQGTQVWAVLSIDSIFETPYIIQSASPSNTINLELPLAPLQRALRSATSATSASLRLTKKDNLPLLSLTIVTNTFSSGSSAGFTAANAQTNGFNDGNGEVDEPTFGLGARDRETIVTQDIQVRVLSASSVEGIHEPRCRDPDVHILLPGLLQLKNISERFTKLASTADRSASAAAGGGLVASANTPSPRLELAATMHGSLRLSIATDALNISSVWTGLSNPELDPGQVEGGEEGLRNHPSTIMKAKDSSREDAWAKVRIDGKDWGRVLGVGRLGGRVIACFCHEHALILYVYLSNDDDGGDESVLTYYISSYSA
ncbi:MAG: hypothetical protein M1835_001455 [Candelina submexicana]|nr:MAG: hypothetical protein M1835_001455 [Candelina submexicana]